MTKNRPNSRLLSLLAILAGAQTILAFAPFNFHTTAFIGPALLLTTWISAAPRKALLRGWLFGLGFFGVGVSWVAISIHRFGGSSFFLAGLITTLFICTLALFPAIQGYFFTKIFKKNGFTKLILGFPLSWIIFEWIRGYIFTGFPWLFLGYSQVSTPLKIFAPLLGVYGVSFAVVLISALFVYLFLKHNAHALFISLLFLLLFFTTFVFCKDIQWTSQSGDAVAVALVQGDIPILTKWDREKIIQNINSYLRLTEKYWNKRLIVWPENAIPLLQAQTGDLFSQLTKLALKTNSSLVTGMPVANNNRYYNAMISLGKNKSEYLKRRLVPFGEYFPLKKLTGWILKYLTIPMSDLSKGPFRQPQFIANGLAIAPAICYEIAYPTLILSYFPQASLIITITEDAWFGHSIAAAQHLQMAQMRSLETGRFQLVSTNTGITAIIGPDGKIINQAPAFKPYVLTGTVFPMQGETPWVKLATKIV